MKKRKRQVRRPPASDGLSIVELAAKTGTTARTIRFWVHEGLLAPAVFQGRSTRYTAEHVTMLQAIRKLRREEHLGLDAIQRRLRDLSIAEIQRMVDPPEPALAPGAAAPAAASPVAPQGLPATATTSRPTASGRVSWERIELLPGLELLVRADASPHLRAAVLQIEHHFLGTSESPAPLST